MPRIGVVSVQGAFAEHELALQAAARDPDLETVQLRRADEARTCHGFVLPGGESTAISKLLLSSGLGEALKDRIRHGAAVLGTCAGAILLASEGDPQVQRTGTELLGAMDIAVERNAWGRQRDSFEAPVRILGDEDPFHGVFIRAPAIARWWGTAAPAAWIKDEVVGVRQGRALALTFHPELSGDPRLHRWLIDQAADHEAEDQT